jgi:hypothetical protein
MYNLHTYCIIWSYVCVVCAVHERSNFDFSFDEDRPPPLKRTYAQYKEYAAIAEEHNRRSTSNKKYAHEGVKKIWCLDCLPYACHIHWTIDAMHCLNNIICDCLSSLRPTNSGDKKLYKFTNRTLR